MKSGQTILAVLAGMAMLAMPLTAAAAGFNRNYDSRGTRGVRASAPRTFSAPRNFSAPARSFSAPRANFGARANLSAPRTFNFAPARPAPVARPAFAGFRAPAPKPATALRSFDRVSAGVNARPAFAQTRFNAPAVPTVWTQPAVATAGPVAPYVVRVGHHHYEPDADDYYRGGYGAGPSVVCDEDGDDCVPGGYYQGSYYAPSSYYFEQGPGESPSGYLNHLLYARQMAWIKYQNALARGDRVAAKHLYKAYVSLNNRIARARGRLGYGYASGPLPAVAPPVAFAPPAAYGPPAAYAPPPNAGSPLGSLLGGVVGGSPSYPGYGYNSALGYNPAYANYGAGAGGYGYNNPYGYNNGGYNNGGLTTMLGPLLQQFIP